MVVSFSREPWNACLALPNLRFARFDAGDVWREFEDRRNGEIGQLVVASIWVATVVLMSSCKFPSVPME